jgi:NAD(P)-dependent dehydrogenase (short-subunit alcohol dehydrogenase family)
LGRLRVAVTGGTSGLGLALVREFDRRGARVAFVGRDAGRVQRVARERPRTHGIVGDVAFKDEIYPIALQIAAALSGLDVLVNNASSLGPTPLAPLGDTRVRGFRARARDQRARSVSSHQGAAWRAHRLGARRAWRGGAQRVERRGDQRISGWGAYGASKAALST